MGTDKQRGELIRARRRALGWTQEALGGRLGVTGKAISKWERGLSMPDVALIAPLADALRVGAAELLAGAARDPLGTSFIENAAATAPACPARSAEDADAVPGADTGFVVSPLLFGSNLEHTRACVASGISAQLLRNRKFAGKPVYGAGCASEWFAVGEHAYLAFGEAYTRHVQPDKMPRRFERNAQYLQNPDGRGECGVGQRGVDVEAGRAYELRVVARTDAPCRLTARLTGSAERAVRAEAAFDVAPGGWTTYRAAFVSETDDADATLTLTLAARGGLWLGAVSLLPEDSFRGMRRDVIERLRALGVGVLRWPGGNFAGEYRWKDGLLPADERAPLESYLGIETQPHTGGYDFHEIGTDDFAALCREIGAEPYITLNPAWDTPRESAEWVEYCNGGADTEYGRLRAERGHPAPYNVRFWSLGNELGYGHMEGPNSILAYTAAAADHAAAMRAVCPGLCLCASGRYPAEDWLAGSARRLGGVADLFSLHYYFPEPDYTSPEAFARSYDTLMRKLDDYRDVFRAMREGLPEGTRIAFDEWNVWYAWYRRGGVYEGVFAAAMLHRLIGEAARGGLALACHFEAVNEGAIRVTPRGAAFTAAGQVLALMARHAGGRLRIARDDAVVTDRDGVQTVTLANRAPDAVRTFRFAANGGLLRCRLYAAPVPPLPDSDYEVRDVVPRDEGDGRLAADVPAFGVLHVETRLLP